MHITLKQEWQVWRAEPQRGWPEPDITVPAGRHEAEVMPNPTVPGGDDWIVVTINGVKAGMSRQGWNAWPLLAYKTALIQSGVNYEQVRQLDYPLNELLKGNVHKLVELFRSFEVIIEE